MSWRATRRELLRAASGAKAAASVAIASRGVAGQSTRARNQEETGAHVPEQGTATDSISTTGDWPMEGQDTARSYFNEHAPGPKGDIQREWLVETGSPGLHLDTIVDGTGYFVNNSRGIGAIDVETSETVWRQNFDDGAGIPVYHRGTLLVDTSFPGRIVALEADDGEIRWQHETGPSNPQTSVVEDGWAFVGGREHGQIEVYEVADGTKQWEYDPGFYGATPSCLVNDLLVCAAWESDRDDSDNRFYGAGKLFALEQDTGELVWEHTLGEQVVLGAQEMGGRLYATYDYPAELVAYDSRSGELLWKRAFDLDFGPSLALGDGIVYLTFGEGMVEAVDASNQETKWSTGIPAVSFVGQPALGAAELYAPAYMDSASSKLFGINRSTGEVRWEHGLPGDIPYKPCVVDDVVYMDGTSHGFVIALGGERFDPAVDGFGFANWSGETGETPEGRQFRYEYEGVTRQDVLDAITNSWELMGFGDVVERLLARFVYSFIDRQAATNGHCYGMVFAADAYYQNPSKLPAGIDSAGEIPHPTGEYDTVGDRISAYHTSQLLTSEVLWYGLLGRQGDHIDSAVALENIVDEIDATGTAGVALFRDGGGHQVLAYEYEQRANEVELFVYDPNLPATDYETAAEPFRSLTVDADDGELSEPYGTLYDRFVYIDPELSVATAEAMISKDTLAAELIDALFVGLGSPARLEVEAPPGTTVIRPTTDRETRVATEYSDAVLIIGASPDEYDVTVVGEGEGEYALETFGVQNGDVVLETTTTGTISEDRRVTYSVTLASEGAESKIEETDGGSDGSIESPWAGLFPLLAAAAAGSTVAIGVLYLLFRKAEGGDTPAE